MLRITSVWLLLMLLAVSAAAQTTPATCTCRQDFEQMRQLIATNYAGYRDKVTPATQPRLDSLTALVRARADTVRAANCGVVLYQWLTFFRDGHLALRNDQVPTLDSAAIRARYAATERLPWTRASFRAYLDDPTRPKQPLEGIWRDAGNDYAVGLVATPDARYQGFVLRADSLWWMPGQVKFAFSAPTTTAPGQATYYMRNHTAQARTVTLPADGQLDMQGTSWYRTYPRPARLPVVPAPFSFRMLDDTTALYRIASFDGRYRPLIDSLTRANAANLRRTRLLILDLRDNGGGSDGSYRSITPYLYTQPVREVGVQLLSTSDNNRKYSGALYPNMSWLEKLHFTGLRRRLDAHLGELVPQRRNGRRVSTRRQLRRHPGVGRVAVLQNRNCGSTTEQFLLEARQSQKTTLFGENSAGILDYANMQFQPLACYQLTLGWATSRSFRLDQGESIDGVGIAPTVRLNPQAPDVVEQVRQWYRQK